ncbi:MAG: hypothetical protein QOI12_1282 [Alphaproteobacteria bacterium]|jgi:hypothetical protein|nr:hypothetical protein [Alphaproteobacteria bacterium]
MVARGVPDPGMTVDEPRRGAGCNKSVTSDI